MLRSPLLFLALVSFDALAVPVGTLTPSIGGPANGGDYEIFLVEPFPTIQAHGPTSALQQLGIFEPAINNHGEVAYLKYDPFAGLQVYSTFRGQISNSTSGNIRFPDINDAGEVVYADLAPGDGLHVYSTVRGDLGRGNLPRINNNGDIYTSTSQRVALLDNGEQIYAVADAQGTFQIASSARGQLSSFPVGTTGGPVGANNVGDVIYTGGGQLRSMTGDLFFGDSLGRAYSVGGYPDINDFGDIVTSVWFNVSELGAGINSFDTVLSVILTSRGDFFRSLGYSNWIPQSVDLGSGYVATLRYSSPPIAVPEPMGMTLFLGGIGLLSLSLLRRRPNPKE